MKPLLVLTLLLGLLVGAPAAATAEGSPLPRATDAAAQSVLGDGAAWCWFSDPRSVYVTSPRPQTLTAWIDSTGRIVVSSFDHATAKVSWVTLRSFFVVDDHNNPSLLVHPDGRVSAFWSGHNEGAIWVRTTSRSGDITSFGPPRAITSFAPGDRVVTYTNPVLLPAENGRIYVFFRSGHLHQAFITSDDDGVTWSPAVVAVEEPDQRPYVKYGSDGAGTIAMAFTDGHPDERKSSVFYSAMRAGQYLRADGSVIKQVADGPLTPSQGDLLWSAAQGVSGWVHDVALDASGRPVVVFATISSPSVHRYHYARYDGTVWKVQELAPAGGTIATNGRENSYSGGITLDHQDPSTVYLSRPGSDPAINEIERWRTPDAGASWVAEAITSGSTETNVRPVRPRGLPSDARMQAVWMKGTYPYFTTFRTSLYGSAAVDRGTARATTTRISSSALATVQGQPVSLHARLLDTDGNVLPAAEVTLVERRVGDRTWHRVTEAVTADDGLVGFPVTPTESSEYQVAWPGDDARAASSSPVVQVRVVRRTALRTSVPAAPIPVGGALALSARLVNGNGGGVGDRAVTLVGRRPGASAWTPLATGRTARDGLFVFRRLLLLPTVYQVRFSGDGLNLASTSSSIALSPVRGSLKSAAGR